jgi:hypothetical protein
MDSKTFGIGILSLMAVILIVLQNVPTAPAGTAIKDRDYTCVTTNLASGGEGLYITDSRTGLCAVFTWDAARRVVSLRDVRPVADAFE